MHGCILHAAAVTMVKNGKALVPAINARDGTVQLTSKRGLGTWIPLNDDVRVLELNGEMQRERVQRWLNNLGDTEKPLDEEDAVSVGVQEGGVKQLILQLLRADRELTENASDCPPPC